MPHTLILPDGIFPKLSWLMQELQSQLSTTTPRPTSEKEFQVVLDALEEDLLKMEPCLEMEPANSPFRDMWDACEDILETLIEAWEEQSRSMLRESRAILSNLYQHLSSAENLMTPEVCLDFVY